MTQTIQVKSHWIDKMPAVVHVDGSARPQIVSKAENFFYWLILENFNRLTGCPVLVNTSFNAHEEPIIADLNGGIRALKNGVCDFVTDGKSLFLVD
jgi:carbamoyltransferase